MKKAEALELLKQMIDMYDKQHEAWLNAPMTGFDMKHLLYLIYHLHSDEETSLPSVEAEK